MERSTRAVPLYGQAEVCVGLKTTAAVDPDPEGTQYYVVLQGSTLDHVTTAQRTSDGTSVVFKAPGHNVAESVSVVVYVCHGGDDEMAEVTPQLSPAGDTLSLTYERDTVQEVAELLMTPTLLTSSSYRDILKKLGPGGELEVGQHRGRDGVDLGTSSILQDTKDRPRCSAETLVDEQNTEVTEMLGGHEEASGKDGSLGKEGDEGHMKDKLKDLDAPLTLAVANMTYPCEWSNLRTNHNEDKDIPMRETALHVAVRLGLPQLSHFLVRQPGGQKVATLANEEGDTPLFLAQRSGDDTLLKTLTQPPGTSCLAPCPVALLWSDTCSALRGCSSTGSLTLITTHTRTEDSSTHTQAIHTYRQKVKEWTQLNHMRGEKEDDMKERRNTENSGIHSGCSGELRKGLLIEDQAFVDSVFEEQLVLSLDEDDELTHITPENSRSPPASSRSSRTLTHSTASAAARLTAMLNGRTQVDEQEVKVSVSGVTSDSTSTDSRDGREAASPPPGATDTPPPSGAEEKSAVASPSPPPSPSSCSPLSSPSPADRALARLLHSSRTEPSNQAQLSSPSGSCDFSLSPTLVALEVDSEEEEDEVLTKMPLPQMPSETNGEERDERDLPPTCTRSLSASSAQSPTPSKNAVDQGVRLRSYSYSSPKISLLPPRFSRDTHTPAAEQPQDGAFPSSSGSRSLLQALSLSKSLYLLHPGKHRAASLTDQAQEKRERFRRRAQSAEDESSMELADSLQHLTLSEFLKEIEEEEWDRYIIPSKSESEKYKVSRTFSFLKSRMSSTRNKNKGKAKDREGKEKDRQSNGHLFSSGSCAGPTVCLVCDKPATGKELLHCSNCTLTVHKNCRDSATPCLKKLQDKYAVSNVKSRTASLPQNFTVRESSNVSPNSPSASLPMTVSRDNRRDPTPPANSLSRSVPGPNERLSESPEGDMDSALWRTHSQSDELLKAESSTSTDSSIVEDVVDSPLQNELARDAADLEAESWSLAVDAHFCKGQEKRLINRQDVIYELMQTELHHVQTLCVMAEIFRRGLREEVQLDPDAIGRIFPCLDELLPLHRDFLTSMRERRHDSGQPEAGDRNYIVQRIGDILLQQFSGENAERMKQVYGQFCSHHNEAVSFFKELQQQNKRFQTFIRQQSSNLLVRRREIPECILLVTQRITKYPVLIERILQHTQEGSTEHAEVSRSLVLIRELIASVDQRVRQYEQEARLQEVLTRLENKSSAKLKNGHAFRKQDIQARGRTLTHQGTILWKTATGRLKDVLALLLTDTLIFLQEKDQKFTFAAVDQKPPVISLQKLIVREVANEERGMFLISASSAGPEMYEVHTSSKDDRNAWMRLIREAVESCPEEDEEMSSESEEEKRVTEAKLQKIQQIQESLTSQDQLICSTLEEKLQIYSELSALQGGVASDTEPRLLVRPNPEEIPQAHVLLAAALREVEVLKATLSSCSDPLLSSPSPIPSPGPGPGPGPQQGSPSVQLTPPGSPKSGSEREEERGEAVSSADPETPSPSPDTSALEEDPFSTATPTPMEGSPNVNVKVCRSVQSLTQLLYSLQAAVTIQDSCFEIQRLHLSSSTTTTNSCGPRPSPTGTSSSSLHPRQPSSSSSSSNTSSTSTSTSSSSGCVRGSALQEQERQREAEKRREEVAAVARLQTSLAQERQQWERERNARQLQQEEAESRLEAREQQCHLEAERLQRERGELEEQLQDYQQSLERLREGQRSVERERQRILTQGRLLDSWRNTRRTSPGNMVIPLDIIQDMDLPLPEDGSGSVFVNEAAFHTSSINNRHLHHHQHQHHHHHPPRHPPPPHLHHRPPLHGVQSDHNPPGPSPDTHLSHTHNNSINSLLDRSNQRHSNTHAHTHSHSTLGGVTGDASGQLAEHSSHELNVSGIIREGWSPATTFPGYSHHPFLLDPYITVETEVGEDGVEENIVYL